MSITRPEIDSLLEKTEENPFLLCSIASKRACDINNMLRGQHKRAVEASDFDDVTIIVSGKDPISIAMDELEDGILGYNAAEFDTEIADGDTNN